MATSKSTALKRVTSAAEVAQRAEAKAEEALSKRDHAIAAARQADPAPTYQEIADAAGVTKDRVSQVLQAQRKS